MRRRGHKEYHAQPIQNAALLLRVGTPETTVVTLFNAATKTTMIPSAVLGAPGADTHITSSGLLSVVPQLNDAKIRPLELQGICNLHANQR